MIEIVSANCTNLRFRLSMPLNAFFAKGSEIRMGIDWNFHGYPTITGRDSYSLKRIKRGFGRTLEWRDLKMKYLSLIHI